jgi:oxalate---CoA ligase
VAISSVRGAVALVPTLAEVIENNATARPFDAALICPQRGILDFAGLSRAIAKIGDVLRSAGIDQRGTVAVGLPSGPEFALAILAIASHAIVVPLNPAATVEELDELFRRLRLSALVVQGDTSSPARAAAQRHDAAIIEASAGVSSIGLTLRPARTASAREPVGPPGCALILQTSGTTARPKLVPITHGNLIAATERIGHWYRLTNTDRCLAAAPLHYGYGVRISLLGPIMVGSSTICPDSFNPKHLFDLLAEHRPTWYVASPAYHSAVLELARVRTPIEHSLRFAVCGGAPVPDGIRREWEDVLGVPLLTAYGLTETGHVAANNAPPGPRKLGSVGTPWPGELRIISDDGATLPRGEIGEVVAGGPGIMPGYLDDETPRIDGWFRTGDLGTIDDDGFLTIRGRVKDMINRGGEKIAPLEIDQAMLAHPAVKEAAAFAIAHPRLGQDVAAAVVPHNRDQFDTLDLRRYLRGRLAPVKVPRRIFAVSELPRNAAGKITRDALTTAFQHAPDGEPGRAPLSAYEILIADIWKELLGRHDIGVDDDFFEKGGDSLLAVRMLLEVEALFDMKVPEETLFEAATIRQIVRCLTEDTGEPPQTIVQLHGGTGTPVFFFHGDFLGMGVYARRIASLIGTERPFYLVTPHGAARNDPVPDTIQEMAAERLESIRQARPHGPYVIAGFCSGGLIAMDVARRLIAMGETVETVLIIEPVSFNARPTLRLIARMLGLSDEVSRPCEANRWRQRLMYGVWALLMKGNANVERAQIFRSLPRDAQVKKLARKLRALQARVRAIVTGHVPAKTQPHGGDPGDSIELWDTEVWRAGGRALAAYIPRLPPTRVICYVGKATGGFKFSPKPWKRLGPIEIVEVPGEHMTCITTHATTLAEAMRRDLASRLPADRLPHYRRDAELRNKALTDAQ